jgi:acetylornithine deacetylase/succinyl-diaminopimelate desuccinylase-like protein
VVSGDKPFAAGAYDENSPLRAACCPVPGADRPEGAVEPPTAAWNAVFSGHDSRHGHCALGPDSGEHHTPSEWLDLGSFARTYDFLVALLRRLTEG